MRRPRAGSQAVPQDRGAVRGGGGAKVPWWQRGSVLALAVLIPVGILSSAAGAALALLVLDGTPGEDSAEAGFARDMIVHHAQAVEMAEVLRDRTESEEMRLLAADMALTQQAQIGRMEGWLSIWGLPATGMDPPMAWMGHPVTEGRMPGMASPAQIEDLRDAPPEEVDELFLQLMIPHHEAVHPMTEAVLARTSHQEVERLAGAISAHQEAEIQIMQDMLRERGLPRAEGVEQQHHSGEEHAHDPRGGGVGVVPGELARGLVHGASQGASAFLAGLAAFVALVWLPAARDVGAGQEAAEFFARWMWPLFGLLVIAGVAELSMYAVHASGEPFSVGLFWEALSGTRTGDTWMARFGLGALTVAAATWAAGRPGRLPFWWLSVALGGAMLATLTRLSHAAAEGGLAPLAADWFHAAAAAMWMGGLLGFTLALLGPARAVPAPLRTELRRRAARRFSGAATIAVAVLVFTGSYAILLHVPNISALFGTPYGLALLAKLGLLTVLLAVGGANLVLGGRGPFARLVGLELVLALGVFAATGLLTSTPPAAALPP